MNKYDINLVFFNKSSSPYAIMIVERFNKTIREKILKYQESYNTKRYIDELPWLVKAYNNNCHTMIHMTPLYAETKKYVDIPKLERKLRIKNEIE